MVKINQNFVGKKFSRSHKSDLGPKSDFFDALKKIFK